MCGRYVNSNIDILDHWCTCPLFPVVNLANHRDGVSGTSNREAQMGVRGGDYEEHAM